MGYYIQYDTDIVKTEMQTRSAGKQIKLSWIVILLVTTILGCTAYSYKDAMQDFLLPGDAKVTAAALEALADDIRKGESFEEAVTAFCVEIVENADISN